MANNFEKATQIMNVDNRSPAGDSTYGPLDADDPGYTDPADLADGQAGASTTTDEHGDVHVSQRPMR